MPGPSKRKLKPKKVSAAQFSKETAKQVRAVAKEVQRTGRLRSLATGKFINVTTRNITNVALGKAVKKTGKEISRDTKQIKRTLKSATKLFNELKDAFKSKKQKAAPAKPTRTTAPKKKPPQPPSKPAKQKPPAKPAKKKSPAQKPAKQPPIKRGRESRIYEVSELPEAFNNSTLSGTLEELHENASGYDSFLKPGEVWAFRFFGNNSWQTFGSFEQLLATFEKYKTVADYGDEEDAKNDLEDALKIIRFKAPGKDAKQIDSIKLWRAKKNAQVQARAEKRKQTKQEKSDLKRQIREANKLTDRLIRESREKEFELRRARAELKRVKEEKRTERKNRK